MDKEIFYEIIDSLKTIIASTEFEGKVYSVGGCERSILLDKYDIKDIDLVVEMENGGVKFAKWLENQGLTDGSVVTYENFGTAMFRLKKFPNQEIEVVHTRKETYRDKNSRNPETSYGTIEEDSLRRDFTINAIYRNISTGKFYDKDNRGRNDIHDKIIRTCDNPNIIFKEDPLRILRAIRFATTLGFKLDYDTLKGIKENANRLDIISQERITDEFSKIIGDNIENLYLLKFTNVLKQIAPEIDEAFFSKNDKTPLWLDFVLMQPKYILSLCWIATKMHFNGMDAEIFLKRMKYPNSDIKKVLLISSCVKPFIRAFKENNVPELRKLKYRIHDRDLWDMLIYTSQPFMGEDCAFDVFNKTNYDPINWSTYTFPINGYMIMNITGQKSGPIIHKIKENLLDEVFYNPSLTRKDLIKILRKRYSIKPSLWQKIKTLIN